MGVSWVGETPETSASGRARILSFMPDVSRMSLTPSFQISPGFLELLVYVTSFDSLVEKLLIFTVKVGGKKALFFVLFLLLQKADVSPSR